MRPCLCKELERVSDNGSLVSRVGIAISRGSPSLSSLIFYTQYPFCKPNGILHLIYSKTCRVPMLLAVSETLRLYDQVLLTYLTGVSTSIFDREPRHIISPTSQIVATASKLWHSNYGLYRIYWEDKAHEKPVRLTKQDFINRTEPCRCSATWPRTFPIQRWEIACMDCKPALKLQVLGVQQVEVLVRSLETLDDWMHPVQLKFHEICLKNVNRVCFCRRAYIYRGPSHLMGQFTVAQAQEEITLAWSKSRRTDRVLGLEWLAGNFIMYTKEM